MPERLPSPIAPLVVGLLVAVLGLLLWSAPLNPAPAYASCASGSPSGSPYAFTGIVTATDWQGRLATVRTDAGQTVTVRGTPGGKNSATSVDRRYEVGGRYEFHPVNASSPYEDNDCTATRLLGRVAVPPPAEGQPTAGGQPKGPGLIAIGVLVLAIGVYIGRRGIPGRAPGR